MKLISFAVISLLAITNTGTQRRQQSQNTVTQRRRQPQSAVTQRRQQPQSTTTQRRQHLSQPSEWYWTQRRQQPQSTTTQRAYRPQSTTTQRAQRPRGAVVQRSRQSQNTGTQRAQRSRVLLPSVHSRQNRDAVVQLHGKLGVLLPRFYRDNRRQSLQDRLDKLSNTQETQDAIKTYNTPINAAKKDGSMDLLLRYYP
ncbi:hypothetical protein BASA83_013805 [Batrachochytrium salamandrivorans]|nr:hypothetical protein BASA83_013805 [Batrachochytrium salamandrivorans]